MNSIGTLFLTRPTWTASFTSVVKTLKLATCVVPKNVNSVRMIIDHDILS
jgi:hypothetical protein